MLLPSLPRKHKFRIIFMQRDIEEVAESQKKMRERLAGGAAGGDERLTTELEQHRTRMLELLRQSPNVEVIEVDYASLLAHGDANAERVATFAGIAPEKVKAMIAVIDSSLRHVIPSAVEGTRRIT